MGKWRKEHIEYWRDDLLIRDNGFSNFQSILRNKTIEILDSASITYEESISNHLALNEKDKKVKMIALKLDNESEVWIYHDMAEYDIGGTHHIYEEWGYLKPAELQDEFTKSFKDILKLK